MLKRTALLAPLALAATFALAQSPVTLARKLVEGAKDTYKVTMKVDIFPAEGSPMGNSNEPLVSMTYENQVVFAIGKADTESKSSVPASIVEMVIKKGKLTASGMGGPMIEGMMGQMPDEIKATGSLDAQNRLNNFKVPSGDFAMRLSGLRQAVQLLAGVEFPAKEVKVGDTWDVVVPKSAETGNKEAKLVAKLVGEKKVESVDAWEITLTGKVPYAFDSSSMGDAGGMTAGMGEFTVTGWYEGTTTAIVEKATGRVIRVDNKSKLNSSMEVGSQGMAFETNGDTTITIELAK